MTQKSISWGELAELTHAKQVEAFNWCACEEGETYPFSDCPVNSDYVGYCLDCDAQLSAETVKAHTCPSIAPICGDCLYPLNTCNCRER